MFCAALKLPINHLMLSTQCDWGCPQQHICSSQDSADGCQRGSREAEEWKRQGKNERMGKKMGGMKLKDWQLMLSRLPFVGALNTFGGSEHHSAWMWSSFSCWKQRQKGTFKCARLLNSFISLKQAPPTLMGAVFLMRTCQSYHWLGAR